MSLEEGQRIDRFEQVVRDENEDLWIRLQALGELARRGYANRFVNVAITTTCAAVGLAAIEYLARGGQQNTEESVFVAIARGPLTLVPVRLAALEHVRDTTNLVRIAMDTSVPEVGIAVLVRLGDTKATRRPVMDLAEHAKNTHVRLFARALLAQDDGK